MLGSEDFWSDIEDAIRNRTTKFLFVLSRTSNEKPGVLQELALAKRVGKGREDFVIPLKVDDLASDETMIELTRLNSINFREDGWVVSRNCWRSWRRTGCPRTRASMRLRWQPCGRTTSILARRSTPAASRRPAVGFVFVRALHVGQEHFAGSWNPQLLKTLRNADVCIASLTRENLNAEWILFDAVAVELRDRHVRLALFGLDINQGELWCIEERLHVRR